MTNKFLHAFILLVAALVSCPSIQAADAVNLASSRGDGVIIGDVDNDGAVNINDVTTLVNFLLKKGPNDFFLVTYDTNRDDKVDISDVTMLINYLLKGAWPWDEVQQPTETITVNGASFKMVTVQGGTFIMGANDNDTLAHNSEKPAHQVTLSTYSIGQTEVTQPLWRAVMGCNPSHFALPFYFDPNTPIENVSWDQCQAFILKLNELTGRHFRMPTEAEWEYAARGGNQSKGYIYSGSDDPNHVAWYGGNNQNERTKIVAIKVPNELGLYDMTGNVQEWCQDWTSTAINPRYYDTEEYYKDGRYGSEAQTNPTGLATGICHVVRGGNYWQPAEVIGVACVEAMEPSYQGAVGLRLVLDEEDSPKFRLSETVITMVKGESESVAILHGNGAYRLVVADGHATAAISGDSLVVTGAQVGTTTVTVTDTATGATAVLTVIVTPVVTFTVGGVTFEMVDVQGGPFMRNSICNNEYREYEWEAHSYSWLVLSNYLIGKTEVTQELWQAVMGDNPSYFKGDMNSPVEQVSWEDCQEFIFRLNELTGKNFRLPTEAEWEYAARGGCKSQGYEYSGSSTIGDVAWYSGNASGKPHPVGTKAPNELGIYDMTGNVWEWCMDWVEEEEIPFYEGYKICGPFHGTTRVRRGGCWSGTAENCHLLTTSGSAPADSNIRLGLRLVLDEDHYDSLHFSERVITVPVGGSKTVKLLNGRGYYGAAGGEDNFACAFNGDNLVVTGLHEGVNTVHVWSGFNDPVVLTVIVKP